MSEACRRRLPAAMFALHPVGRYWCDECYTRQTAGLCALCRDPLCSESYAR